MLATKRRSTPGVIQQLLDEPYRFQFFQAIRILELWLVQHGVPQDNAVAHHLRFRNSLSLSFPPSEIEALEIGASGAAAGEDAVAQALALGKVVPLQITPAFMGFLGSSGALPLHYTERIAAHALYERDGGPRAFFDVFSNRAVALLYEAWRKYRLEWKYALGDSDRFLPLLRSFAGIGQRSLKHRLAAEDGGVLDETMGSYAAALRQRPASAALMQAVLQHYFFVPIAVRQFVGRWYELPHSQQSRLGLANASIGSTALVGGRVWQRDLRVLLRIGPLDRSHFDAFLPHGSAAKSLGRLIAMFTGVCLEYEVQLVLRGQEVRGANLASGRDSGRLGWDTFLASGNQSDDRSDVRYRLHAIA